MVCHRQSHTRRTQSGRVADPSPERIKQLAAEIREHWSPRTHARRAAEASVQIEMMTVSLLELGRDRSPRDE